MSEPAFIHPTAYVHPTAIIFSNVRIGAERLFSEIGYILDTPGYVVMPKELMALNPMSKLVGRHPNHEVTSEDREIVRRYLS
jgi:hypothetical protein